jgi:hypothetical protein
MYLYNSIPRIRQDTNLRSSYSALRNRRLQPINVRCVSSCVAEIAKVRASLFQINGAKKDPLVLPDAEGTPTTLTEKVYVPVKEHPDVSTHHEYDVSVLPVAPTVPTETPQLAHLYG